MKEKSKKQSYEPCGDYITQAMRTWRNRYSRAQKHKEEVNLKRLKDNEKKDYKNGRIQHKIIRICYKIAREEKKAFRSCGPSF